MSNEALSQLAAAAEKNGFSLHESVTADRLSRVDSNIMTGAAICGQAESVRCGFDWDAQWGEDAIAVPYQIGTVGGEVVAPPEADKQLHLVILPVYHVVAHIDGVGQTTSDVDGPGATGELVWTVLRPAGSVD